MVILSKKEEINEYHLEINVDGKPLVEKTLIDLKKIIKKSILITFNNAGHFSYIDKEKETLHLIKNFIKKED